MDLKHKRVFVAGHFQLCEDEHDLHPHMEAHGAAFVDKLTGP